MKIALLCVCSCALFASRLEAAPPADLETIHPLTGLGAHTLEGFTGWNAALHLSAFAAAPAIVYSGADTETHNLFARNQALEPYTTPGVYLGYLLPLAAAGSLMGYGLKQGSSRALAAGSAVLQSTAIALVYQSLLKAVTGRPAPPAGEIDGDGASRSFRFGLLRGGIHYGWPSGHMMTSVAIVTSLTRIYPDSWGARLGGGLFLAYMAGSVAMHEEGSMHWTSDMVSGALMGYAIGRGVGAGFAERLEDPELGAARVDLSPLSLPGGAGLSLSGCF